MMQPGRHVVFVTGGTGYLGSALIPELLAHGHTVRALIRPGAKRRLPAGAEPVVGDALRAETFAAAVPPADTLVHLVGTPKPNPAKGKEFRRVDLGSIQAAVSAAKSAGVRHFVYLSVAQPAPVMRAYIEVREAGESLIRRSGFAATILRPWYVLGPGHRWPYLLLPFYAILARVPATAEGARRLGLVTRREMVAALVRAVEDPPSDIRIVGVPEMVQHRRYLKRQPPQVRRESR
jgi:uncharacterized protein YbjT (DUF2867 family)